MPRLLFEKKGNAVWISHLDLMRLFQRAFQRAGLNLTHTQGYNPRPSVSIALPLSVGVESACELLDFELDGQTVANSEIVERLNRSLVEGIRVLRVYDNGQKIRDLAYLSCSVTLEYDIGADEVLVEEIRALFARESLPVVKKGKNGPTEQDIIPMIRKIDVQLVDDHTVCIDALVCCQNRLSMKNGKRGLLALTPLVIMLVVFLVGSLIAGDFYRIPIS
jgi:radical SAM-linked protein